MRNRPRQTPAILFEPGSNARGRGRPLAGTVPAANADRGAADLAGARGVRSQSPSFRACRPPAADILAPCVERVPARAAAETRAGPARRAG